MYKKIIRVSQILIPINISTIDTPMYQKKNFIDINKENIVVRAHVIDPSLEK